ncbi:GAF domain-containing protein [Hydrogenophaga sp.]|uniref:GAF domain-containing protein n=1 Tax=Hydrogenophaga sp. TaxID=1904254 RepID=UPI002633BD93|nr:GAF domain-containing protein [Hydrogenophaga sp.]
MKVNIHDLGYEPTDLHVTISELMVATADQSDDMLDRTITEVLKTLRDRMNMDVVFCSEFVDGRRVFRQVATGGAHQTVSVGALDELEQSWCQRVVDGRLPRFMADARADPVASALMDQLPFSIGTHISTPIVLKNGEVYGTLCSFSFSPQDNPNPEDLKTLEMTAKLTAMRLDGRNVMPAPRDVPAWDLKPK